MDFTDIVLSIAASFSLLVNVMVLYEYHLARTERLSRRAQEDANNWHDAQTVRRARFVINALETYEECFPCREAIEKGYDKRVMRDKLYP